ncbi:MAG: AIR synthase-related protein, partial [Dehalococcoidia bacterium]
EKLPFLEGAKGYAEDWLFPAGTCRNQEHYSPWVRFAPGITEEMQMLLYTPETSGGLLIAVSADRLETLTGLFAKEGQAYWVIGEAMEGKGIEVTHSVAM